MTAIVTVQNIGLQHRTLPIIFLSPDNNQRLSRGYMCNKKVLHRFCKNSVLFYM